MTAIAQSLPSVVKPARKKSPFALAWWKSLLLTLPMALLSAMMLFGNVGDPSALDPLLLGTLAATWAALVVIFFLMLFTGQTHRFRSLLFTVVAVSLPIAFMTNMIELRGSVALTVEDMLQGKTPFCHLVIPMILAPAALTRTIIFPGSLLTGFASIASMVVMWLGASLVLGRGWCSWVCFYGGYDEGFSRLLKKPVIKNIDRKWTYLPYAVLLGIVLISAVSLSPTYCEWLCPFKTVTEFEAVTSIEIVIKTIVFVGIFLGAVIALPILTRRRIQCGLFCPLGALQNWTNKLSLFELRIDREKCSDCGHCIKNCQTFSLDDASVKRGETLISCTKCAQCIDICPKKAVAFHIKGTSLRATPNLARVLFLYPAYLMLVAIGSGMIASALFRILKLVATGSMI
jgi:ferredoxin